jgi:hypothetical protein
MVHELRTHALTRYSPAKPTSEGVYANRSWAMNLLLVEFPRVPPGARRPFDCWPFIRGAPDSKFKLREGRRVFESVLDPKETTEGMPWPVDGVTPIGSETVTFLLFKKSLQPNGDSSVLQGIGFG